MADFEITWEVDDGYAGGARPQTVEISESEVDPNMSDEDLKTFFWDAIKEDFEQNISPYSKDEDAFIQWVRTLGEK